MRTRTKEILCNSEKNFITLWTFSSNFVNYVFFVISRTRLITQEVFMISFWGKIRERYGNGKSNNNKCERDIGAKYTMHPYFFS